MSDSDDDQQEVDKMSKAKITNLINKLIEERVGLLESMVENQAYNINDLDSKVTKFKEQMPPDMDTEIDLGVYVRDMAKKLCEAELELL
jgi:hypothetical protein